MPVGAHDVDAQLVDPLVGLGEGDLAGRPLGARGAHLAVLGGPDVGQAVDLGLDPQLHQPVPQHRVVVRRVPATAAGPRRSGPSCAGATVPPIETRSFISVVIDTRQPSPTSPSRSASGIRTSVKYTSLNSASPVIWRSGRTSTPGAVHVDHEVGEALVLRLLGVGAGDEHAPAGQVGQRGPHLLAVDDPLVAVLDGSGRQAGHVGAGARLAEQLAPDLLAGEQRAQVAALLGLGAMGDDGRRAHAVADGVAGPRDRRPGRGQPVVDRPLQVG